MSTHGASLHVPSLPSLFLRVLAIFSLIEGGIMLLLPRLLGAVDPVVASLVDAALLMLLGAPVLWLIVIRPLRGVALREHARAGTVAAHARDGIVDMRDDVTHYTRLYASVQSSAVVQERHRLARELHDSLAQTVTLLRLQLCRLEDAHADDPRLRDELGKLAASAARASEEIRQSIFDLRATLPPGPGWIPTLGEYLRSFTTTTGTSVALDAARELPDRLPPATEVQLLRIVQEALANVHRHANAGAAHVRLEPAGRRLRVTIEDQGRGFDPERAPTLERGHFGLATMRERAEGAGGTLVIDSAPGHGTRVVAELPGGM